MLFLGISSENASNEGDPSSISEVVAVEDDDSNKQVIAILGSGDFGRALGGRLVQAGYIVNIGSRDPQRNR